MPTVRPYGVKRAKPSGSADRLLDAAAALVSQFGFHAATMEQIAQQAGVSRATAFTRFGTKLGVLEALNLRCAGSPEAAAIGAALVVQDPLESLRAIIEASCNMWERNGYVMEQLKAIAVLEPQATQLVERQRSYQRRSVEGLIKRLRAAGALQRNLKDDEAVAALHALTSLETFLELRRHGGLSLKQATATIARLASALLREAGPA